MSYYVSITTGPLLSICRSYLWHEKKRTAIKGAVLTVASSSPSSKKCPQGQRYISF